MDIGVLLEYTIAFTPLTILILAIALTVFCREKPLIQLIISEIILGISTLLSILLLQYTLDTEKILAYMFSGFPPPIGVVYQVDAFSSFIASITGSILLLVNPLVYAYYSGLRRYTMPMHSLLLIVYSGVTGIVYTSDYLDMYIMFSLVSITLLLIALYSYRNSSLHILTGLTTLFSITIFFIAVLVIYSGLGTLSIADTAADAANLNGKYFSETYGYALDPVSTLALAVSLIIIAILYPTASIPWSYMDRVLYKRENILLSITTTCLSPIVVLYIVFRLCYTVPLVMSNSLTYYILLTLIVLNVLYGGLFIARSNELLRFLIYYVVIDTSIMMLCISIASEEAISILLYYVIAHTITKTLIISLILGIEPSSSKSLSESQINKRSRLFYKILFIVGVLSATGLPPMNIFIARIMLIKTLISSNYYLLSIIIVYSIVASTIGFVKVYRVYSRTMWSNNMLLKILSSILLCVLVLSIILYPLLTSALSKLSLLVSSRDYRIEYIETSYKLFRLVSGG